MRVMVTGALGNVGHFVIESLLSLGESVVAADVDLGRLEKEYKENPVVQTVFFDFTKTETFAPALQGVDRVFLMRPPHLGKAKDLFPFVQTMARNGIKLVSFLSLMGVENNPVPPHYKIEKYIERLELPYAHIRPSFFMQNLSGVHSVEIREEDRIFIPAGRSKTSFVDAKDIGLVIATVLHAPEQFKNSAHTLTGPEALDYFEVAQILSDVLGRNIHYANPGFWQYRKKYIKERKLDATYVNVTMMLYLMTRLGAANTVTGTFKNLTGQRARSFREFALENRQIWESDADKE